VENVMQTFSVVSGYHTGAGQFAFSETGSLIYARGGVAPDSKDSLVWVDQKGIEQSITDVSMPFYSPRLSPDGQRIAYTALGREAQVWVYDLSRSTNSRLTREGRSGALTWTPEGKQLVFRWFKSLGGNLYRQPYDGSSPMERMTTSESPQWPGSWSSDGNTLAIVEAHPGADIATLDIKSGRVTPFVNSQFNERFPDFSPDGRWIAYTSNESKRDEVYVRPFPGPGMKYHVSSEGGVEPMWARNGKQIFYRWQNQVWAVDIQTGPSFSAGKPRLLFDKPGYNATSPIRDYDLSLDSQRFLMVKHEESKPTPVTEMILVQNWLEELKQRVPTK
jgi:dipeptidyl aminopeptidase/acylaminoacyl peptidase